MRLLFKQRMFSWLDSYDIFDEVGSVLYTVKGQLSWGHCLKIYDAECTEVGMVNERVLSFLPTFEIYMHDNMVGKISKEFTFFKPAFDIDYNGWHVEGDFMEWDYNITNMSGEVIATVSKQLWNWTDTYVIDIQNPTDALSALMLVLAIDAEKCSRD